MTQLRPIRLEREDEALIGAVGARTWRRAVAAPCRGSTAGVSVAGGEPHFGSVRAAWRCAARAAAARGMVALRVCHHQAANPTRRMKRYFTGAKALPRDEETASSRRIYPSGRAAPRRSTSARRRRRAAAALAMEREPGRQHERGAAALAGGDEDAAGGFPRAGPERTMMPPKPVAAEHGAEVGAVAATLAWRWVRAAFAQRLSASPSAAAARRAASGEASSRPATKKGGFIRTRLKWLSRGSSAGRASARGKKIAEAVGIGIPGGEATSVLRLDADQIEPGNPGGETERPPTPAPLPSSSTRSPGLRPRPA